MESIWGLLWGHSPGPLGRVWASVYFQLDVYCHEIVVTVDLGTTNSDILESPAPLPVRMWLFWLVVRPSGDFQVSLWMSLWRKLVPWTTGLFPRQVWATACRTWASSRFIHGVHISFHLWWILALGPEQILSHSLLKGFIGRVCTARVARVCYGDRDVFKAVIELSVTVSCFRGRGCWPYVQPGGPGAAFCPASTVKPVSPACLNLLRI